MVLIPQIFEKLDESALNHPKYWMPLVWAGSIVTRARKEGRIKDDFALKSLVDKLDGYRTVISFLTIVFSYFRYSHVCATI